MSEVKLPPKVKQVDYPQQHILPETVSGRDWRHRLDERCWCKPILTLRPKSDLVRHRDQWTGELAQ